MTGALGLMHPVHFVAHGQRTSLCAGGGAARLESVRCQVEDVDASTVPVPKFAPHMSLQPVQWQRLGSDGTDMGLAA